MQYGLKLISQIFFLFLAQFVFSFSANAAPQKIQIGKFHSRGLLYVSAKAPKKMPVVILVPGSGPQGPEEMIPADSTVDRKSHSIFESISRSFTEAGWNVLCLGKPGIEFYTTDKEKRFYDKKMYMGLRWQQLIENLDEAVNFVKSQASVDPNQVVILGHSQGTQVAVDYAAQNPKISALILIGYSGEDMKTILDWQLFKRPIEYFVATDVDENHDGYVSKEETAKWPGPFDLDDSKLEWNFRKGKDKISYAEIEEDLRNHPYNKDTIPFFQKSAFFSGGVFDRGPLYKKAANLNIPLYVFTGDLDLLTPPKEALLLKKACEAKGKKNCEIEIATGLGHGFSPPRGPRKHPLLDITVGPVDEGFLTALKKLAQRIFNSRI